MGIRLRAQPRPLGSRSAPDARSVGPHARLAPLILVALGLLPTAAVAAEPRTQTGLSLTDAIVRAMQRNPLVLDSTLEWRRVQGMASGVAGVLAENPLLTSQAGVRRDVTFSGRQPSLAASILQPVDLLGQAGARRRAAADQVTAAQARVALVRAEISARVRLVYLAAQVADAETVLRQDRLITARKMQEAVQMRAGLGASSDIDLHLASAETSRAAAALEQAKVRTARALFGLRELLDLPASAQAQPTDILVPTPPELAHAGNEDDLLAHHLSIQAIDKHRIAVDSDIARLERERLPRIAVGVAIERPSDRENFVGLALSFAPALWRRNQGPLAEARVERERADYTRDTTLAGLRRRWAELTHVQRIRREELHAVERMLAHEETVRALVRTGWEAGKFDFFRVLLAERSVADTRQARLDLCAELWGNAIEINRLLGKE
jgi:cobalt-zinc-cadmium efflux system outer membrane protein